MKLQDIKTQSHNWSWPRLNTDALKPNAIKAYPDRKLEFKQSIHLCPVPLMTEVEERHLNPRTKRWEEDDDDEEEEAAESFLIPMIPLFLTAICSSTAASQNHWGLSGTYRWFTTVVCLNILSCTTLTGFTLKSLLVFHKTMGPVCGCR